MRRRALRSPKSATSPHPLAALLRRTSTYFHHLGMEVLDLQSGHALIRLPFGDHLRNSSGGMRGGAIASPIDSAGGLAARSSGEGYFWPSARVDRALRGALGRMMKAEGPMRFWRCLVCERETGKRLRLVGGGPAQTRTCWWCGARYGVADGAIVEQQAGGTAREFDLIQRGIQGDEKSARFFQ